MSKHPSVIKNISETIIKKFKANGESKIGSDCIIWKGGLDWYGYGRLTLTIQGYRKYIKAHRFAWMLHHQQDIDGLIIKQTCRNIKCVNPKHLYSSKAPWTKNTKSKAPKNPAIGPKHGSYKVSPDLIATIIKKAKVETQIEIAKQLHVSQSTVSKVINAKNLPSHS